MIRTRWVFARWPQVSVSIFLLGLLVGCDSARPPARQGRRVVVVGIEGATWRVLRPLLAEGRLPRFARLYQNGSAGILGANEPLDDGALATTLATGLPPARHGIASSVVRAPGGYAVRAVSADTRRAPAIWSLAGALDITVGVAGWPVTFPAEAVRGYMVVPRYDPQAGRSRGYVHPPGALGEGGQARERLEMPGWLEEVRALDEELRAAIGRDLEDLERAVSLYRVYQPRLAFFRFRAVDMAAHRYWQYFEPAYLELASTRGRGVPRERAEALAAALPGAYRFVDECLGSLMQRFPEGTALLVVSEHGMRGVQMTDYLRVDLPALLERLGLLRRDASGAPDWTATSVYPLPDTIFSTRRLCINMRGRETSGLVEPERAAALVAEVVGRLRALATRKGERLFGSVEEVAGSGRQDGTAIELTENLAIDPEGILEIAGKPVEARALYRRVSEDLAIHDPEGILLAAGGGIAPGRYGWSARLEDVAPTLMALLGLPPDPGWSGRPIAGLLGPEIPRDQPAAEPGAAMAPIAPLRRDERDAAEEMREMIRAGHLR